MAGEFNEAFLGTLNERIDGAVQEYTPWVASLEYPFVWTDQKQDLATISAWYESR